MTQQIMDSKIINLEDYRTPKSKVFTGRDRGERVRLDSNIDLLADENEIIKIIIPDNLYSINPSFFEEFFPPAGFISSIEFPVFLGLFRIVLGTFAQLGE